MTWSNGPTLWHELLTQVEEQYGLHSLVAGGCVRDYLSGWQEKDIDIFVLNNEGVLPMRGDAWKKLPPSEDQQTGRYERDERQRILSIDDYQYHQHRVQVICLKIRSAWLGMDFWKPVVGDFDLGICQAAWTLNRDLYVTPAYLQDASERTVTILHTRSIASSVRRANAFVAKHPTWTVKRPPEEGGEDLHQTPSRILNPTTGAK